MKSIFLFLAAALIAASSFSPGAKQAPRTIPAVQLQRPDPAIAQEAVLPARPTRLQVDPASGKPLSVKNSKGAPIVGMDGELYEPYQVKTIERVQRLLAARGLYAGPINGVLDKPTMKAIYEFQKVAGTVQICGVPTPRTRRLLEQGSHT